jgi:hypothetical protein
MPVAVKTVNQIVAWNIAYYRKVAGITQEEMGELIGGRSKRNISADERSWDGTHTREFDAQQLFVLSVAFGIPLVAFFLPPEDDGIDVRYEIQAAGKTAGMKDLMTAAMHDTDEESQVMNAYRWRMRETVARYLHPSWGELLAYWQSDRTTPEVRAAQAEEARADRETLLRIAAKLADAIEYAEKEDSK